MSGEREDILLSRAVDRLADEEQWTEIEALALHDPDLWRRLAEVLRLEARLRTAVRASERIAERVAVGGDAGAPAGAKRPRWRRLRPVAAAAVFLVIGFAAGRYFPGTGKMAALSGGGVLEIGQDDAMDTEKAEGHVVQELPELVLEQLPAPSGTGIEVIYLRRILERRIVDAVYELGRDETGRAVAWRVNPERLRPAGSF